MSTTTTTSESLLGKTLVSVEECINAYDDEMVSFVDGSWFLMGRNARQEFQEGPRILNAKYFDIDDVASKGNSNPKQLPHMMPSPQLFAAAMDALSITNQHHVIVYGSKDCLFPHRAWFQMIAMGHDPNLVHYMQGSLEDWKNAGGPMEADPAKDLLECDSLDLTATPNYKSTKAQNVWNMQDILKAVQDDNVLVVDARAKERFLGQVEEPRPNMRLGHMPRALNVPFTDLLESENKSKFKSTQEMEELFRKAGIIDLQTPQKIVTTCGSGASACALVLALTACGRDITGSYLYDGSWSEWGADPDTPIVKQD